MTIYHGNKLKDFTPIHTFNNSYNDFGSGFYTTPDIELAKEWSYGTYTSGDKGYVHYYNIQLDSLTILDFTKLNSLHWIAEVIYNRKLNITDKEVVQNNITELLARYKLNTDSYDVIIGYRADNSLFTYAESFISGGIYKHTLDLALEVNKSELQVCIKSKKAFNKLTETSIKEVSEKYRVRFAERDRNILSKIKQEQGLILNKKTIYDFIH